MPHAWPVLGGKDNSGNCSPSGGREVTIDCWVTNVQDEGGHQGVPTISSGQNVVIGSNVRVGSGVILGHNVVIHDGTELGDGVIVGDNAVLGRLPSLAVTSTSANKRLDGLSIGAHSRIGAGTVVFAGSKIGSESLIGDQSLVREGCSIGNRTIVGANVTVENNVQIGSRVKIQSKAYLPTDTLIEDDVFIAPGVIMTNDNFMGRTERRFALKKGPRIRRAARVGANATLLPGVEIGEEAFIAAASVVTRNVPPRVLWMGTPARYVRDVPSNELLT